MAGRRLTGGASACDEHREQLVHRKRPVEKLPLETAPGGEEWTGHAYELDQKG